MSQLTQFTGGLSRRQQIFTSSGTFVPSARLLALGGWVEVTCVGGGGGGYTDGTIKTGGAGGKVVRKIVQVTGNVTVTIGAGGTGNSTSPTAGGTTSFGSLVSAEGGLQGNNTNGGGFDSSMPSFGPGGAGAGGNSQVFFSNVETLICKVGIGGPPVEEWGHGGNGTEHYSVFPLDTINAPSNSGDGGTGGGNGGSGICIVEWFE